MCVISEETKSLSEFFLPTPCCVSAASGQKKTEEIEAVSRRIELLRTVILQSDQTRRDLKEELSRVREDLKKRQILPDKKTNGNEFFPLKEKQQMLERLLERLQNEPPNLELAFLKSQLERLKARPISGKKKRKSLLQIDIEKGREAVREAGPVQHLKPWRR